MFFCLLIRPKIKYKKHNKTTNQQGEIFRKIKLDHKHIDFISIDKVIFIVYNKAYYYFIYTMPKIMTTIQFKKPMGLEVNGLRSVYPVMRIWHISSPVGFFN